ncbi:MAG: HD-GYP domain-containing protein [Acidobacteriota bacterium]|nr:HD-GYP domain-containing protein [Acidobacteriota bacterium]
MPLIPDYSEPLLTTIAQMGDRSSVQSGSLLLRVKELEEQHLAFRNSLICAFNQLLDLKDISTGVHSTRLAEWAIRVARKLSIPEDHMYQVEVAALLHDVGKIGVPDAILKKQGPLTSEERAVINRHPEYSWSILRLFPGLEDASLYALHHHESVDGSGYPAGLQGNDIPLVSRIVSVIDAYDAMISNRCYRKGLPHEEAIQRLLKSAGTQFDAEVVQTFLPIAGLQAGEVFAAAGASVSAAL